LSKREIRRTCLHDNQRPSPEEQQTEGEFERQPDAFRDLIAGGGSPSLPAVAGRYHLYVSLACPWASRALIVRISRDFKLPSV